MYSKRLQRKLRAYCLCGTFHLADGFKGWGTRSHHLACIPPAQSTALPPTVPALPEELMSNWQLPCPAAGEWLQFAMGKQEEAGCPSHGHLNGVWTPDFSRLLCELHTKSIVKDEVSALLKTPAALTCIPGDTIGWVKKTQHWPQRKHLGVQLVAQHGFCYAKLNVK